MRTNNSCNNCSNAEPVFNALGHKLNCGVHCERFDLLIDENEFYNEYHGCSFYGGQDWDIL